MTGTRSNFRSSSQTDDGHASVERLLLAAERSVRLIDRSTPLNLASERQRLITVFARGAASSPCFQYARVPDLSLLCHQLDGLSRILEDQGIVGRLLSERARELGDEAILTAAIGSADFPRLATARFPATSSASEGLCRKWLADVPKPVSTELFSSDDRASPRSLISRLHSLIGEKRQVVRVEIRRELSSVAAAGDGFVAVRPGVLLSAEEAERVALHELEAHVLPRLQARKESLSLFRVGCRGSGEHEEGRALLIEERCGLLGASRRFELAARHRAAEMLRQGAVFPELVSSLVRLDVPLEHAVEVATRVFRGGGLAREIVYLPAYLEVRAAFADFPELERYFERGRVSVVAAQIFFDQGLSAAGRQARLPTGAA